jgi:2'-5' RNA ligase
MQGVLPFIHKEPVWQKPSDRLFFALLLAIEAGRLIGVFTRQFGYDNHLGLRVLERRLHISLHLVGDFCSPREDDFYSLWDNVTFAARCAAETVALPPVNITLDTIKSFGRPSSKDGKPRGRPVVLTGKENGLCDLHQSLGGAMRKNGLWAGNRFTPHLTLSYNSNLITEQAIEPIHLRISDFVLIHSELGRTQYNILGRWPLRG